MYVVPGDALMESLEYGLLLRNNAEMGTLSLGLTRGSYGNYMQ